MINLPFLVEFDGYASCDFFLIGENQLNISEGERKVTLGEYERYCAFTKGTTILPPSEKTIGNSIVFQKWNWNCAGATLFDLQQFV